MSGATQFSPPPDSVNGQTQVEPDQLLARRARRDPQAFEELYQRHMNAIYHYHLARTGNVQDAQDLTAQTFLAALEHISSYQGQGSFAGWLFGIASHKVADHFRQKRPSLSLEDAAEMPQPDPRPEDLAITHLQIERVAAVLGALAPERAEALVLRIFCGLSADEVGQIMGRSQAAVKMLVHRGLSDLQKRLVTSFEVES